MSRVPSPTYNPTKPVNLFPLQTTNSASRFLKVCIFLFLFLVSVTLVVFSGLSGRVPFYSPAHDPFDEAALLNITLEEGPTYPPDYPTDNPHPYEPTNISHIAFGIGGSADTWQQRRKYSEAWWEANVTRGYVWLEREPDGKWGSGSDTIPYRVSEDWKRFRGPDSAVRIARIVKELYRVGLPEVRWYVMGDDDTVFFTDNLVSVLTRYDHREMYYIGGNSESVEQDVLHAYGMAFGGGGFAISHPLAKELVKILDGCLDRYYEFYGSDQRIWACITEIGVSFTRERGFHQIDLRGDAYGLLAAHPVAPLVSLHHLDYVSPLFPGRTQLKSLQALFKAYRADPSNTLQQTFCYDFNRNWSVSISWGYTAQIYTSFVTAFDMAMPLQSFKTWRSWGDGPFSFNTRPMSPEPCEQPVVYFFDKVKEVAKGWTMSTYNMNVVEKQKKCYADVMEVKRIVVLAPKMDPREWKMALRRRCCQISDSLTKKSLVVKIRRCKPGESVSF